MLEERVIPDRRGTDFVFSLLVAVLIFGIGPGSAAAESPAPEPASAASAAGVAASFSPSGGFAVSWNATGWTFSGAVPRPDHLKSTKGADAIGPFSSVSEFIPDESRQIEIRVYDTISAARFLETYQADSPNRAPFPTFQRFPSNLHHLAFSGQFSIYSFSSLAADSPWVFFDENRNSVVLSAASHFLQMRSSRDGAGPILCGVDPAIAMIPKGYETSVLLVFGAGINATVESWGNCLTSLSGKPRPANDRGPILSSFGYWTDNGATYYYREADRLGYPGTLRTAARELSTGGTEPGYLQLDSWWYPKGAKDTWKDSGGIYDYTASPDLFPEGLAAFQASLHLPLVVHARWIDEASPYRRRYAMSHNVIVDPAYWNSVADYLKAAGVVVYEQDWLSGPATADENLRDPDAFFGNMAGSLSARGIDIQYCMPLPSHLLQSTLYPNVTSARVSPDRFGPSRWTQFLFDSRLASAVGLWPWCDVFMSAEKENMILAVLSGGVVGVGDPLDRIDRDGVALAARPDGILVKPDTALLPDDSAYVAAANGTSPPMLAESFTDHGGIRAAYIVAYPQGPETGVEIRLDSLGIPAPAYVFDALSGSGAVIGRGSNLKDAVASELGYYLAVPIGPSGVAFLGDSGKIASLGKKRIASLTDDGTLVARVVFAPGEKSVVLRGFAPEKPIVSASRGQVGRLSYDQKTGLFHFEATAATGSATVSIRCPSGREQLRAEEVPTISRRAAPPRHIYPAVEAALHGVAIATKNPGFTSNAYGDYTNADDDYIEWAVTVPEEAEYRLSFRYANGAREDRPLRIDVNGETIEAAFSFPFTGSWVTWTTRSLTARLKSGRNLIRATAIGRSGGNFDYLRVDKDGN